MADRNTFIPRIATILAYDIVAPIVGGALGAALTAPSYLAPTPFQVGMSIARAGMVAHAAAKLGHHAVEVYWIDPPSPAPEAPLFAFTSADGRS